MLSVKDTTTEQSTVTANLLPCRIQHDGPITVSSRYWAPGTTSTLGSENTGEETQRPAENLNVHFRGRKLYGKEVELPEGYTGKVIKVTQDVLQQNRSTSEDDEGDERDENEITTFIAEHKASFDKFIIWNQEGEAMDTDDQYIKGINEWIGLAESVSQTNQFTCLRCTNDILDSQGVKILTVDSFTI
jgi:ribonuclease H2 subunit C